MNLKKLAGLLLTCLFLTGMATASSVSSKLQIGLGGNYGLFSEEDYEDGLGFFALVNYNFSDHFLIQVQGGMQMANTLEDAAGFSKGKLSLFPIQFSLFYRLALSKSMGFRLGGGVGYVLSTFKMDAQADWQALGFTVSQKLKPGILYHGVAAFDLVLSRNVTFFLEGRYVMGKLDAESSITDTFTSEVNTKTWQENQASLSLGAGITFSFGSAPAVQRTVVPEKK